MSMLGILRKSHHASAEEKLEGIKLIEESKELGEEVRPRNERVGWMKLHLGLLGVNGIRNKQSNDK